MPVFRRRSAGPTESTSQDSPGAQSPDRPADSDDASTIRTAEAKKGRPTPKRREAEAGRYQSITGGRRSAGGRSAGPRTPADKSRDKTERASKYQAMKRGEVWALNAKDKGPVRGYVRDYVDSKRRLSEYFMFVLLLLFVGILFARTSAVSLYVDVIMLLVVVSLISQALIFRRAFGRIVPAKFPGQPARGLVLYAMMRAMQFRRFRIPAPRVEPGATV
jgi:hypothetical protein